MKRVTMTQYEKEQMRKKKDRRYIFGTCGTILLVATCLLLMG